MPFLIRLAVVYGINVLALIVVDWMFDSVTIGRWGSLLVGAAVLTIGNTFLKPILTIVTLPLVTALLDEPLKYLVLPDDEPAPPASEPSTPQRRGVVAAEIR